MDLSGLNELSAAAARQLFERFPEFERYARIEREGREAYLAVSVPAPPEADTEHGLLVLSKADEVTVGFDYYHAHFPHMGGAGESLGTGHAIEVIRDLLAEDAAAISWWQGGKWKGSTLVRAGEQPLIQSWLSYDATRVRSWRGKLNRDDPVKAER